MKSIPPYINPSNISNFKSIREDRELVRFKKEVLEFMLTDDFISGKNRGFELSNSDGKILYEKHLVDKCVEELKKLGWECKEWRTCVYIYPPNDEPKIFKYEVLDV
jgi:hypothetical protein